ncbi:DNA double-strand break repair and v(D)J recombination protein XRCC4 domain-containing protein [Hirsutella rhossiliensis]|uniref:DNA double-strand break repair and v(D)J recombination protein XRCC4 domain-containing protein n=1 Tax=Hirsutella rhossiliensis TaxID=111463 RepID=A0A9P8N2I1_9HYPO|nr:DNA double-strand break repair and v(D)J recombination protein XRCC4 domain-containing protein [Hirsutella rhossiliensis]KAH0967073.1 DNA double-strand break repair and v(D)J recombination protein XRCC4 domain-containing protein [Hirsutella rhossiliensis]
MRVLRFPRSDKESTHVLVNVSSAGPKPLDLKLAATEGDEPYACVLKHDRVSSLRVKNCPASEDEWEHILDALLRQEPVEDIQVAAAVQPESSISLTVRKQVQGITQRLGAVTLKCDQSERIELFQWCDWSLDALAKHRKEAADSAAKAREMEAEVAVLQAQLDELLQAKQDDEAALLLKFRDLLNEKKVKIREQQKIITASSFRKQDSASSQPQQAGDNRAPHPAPSRARKRKAARRNVSEETSDDSDQAMDEAAVKSEPDDMDPGNTSDGTASASDDQDDDSPAELGTARDVEPGRSASTGSKGGQQEAPLKKTTRGPPPRRDLPFANKQTTAPPRADEETESDDEL